MYKTVKLGRKMYRVNLERFEEFMAYVTMTVIVVGGMMWFMTHAWWG